MWSETSPSTPPKPPAPPDTPDKKINTDTTYTLLAPLPGFGIDANGKTIPFETDPKKNPCAFGNYMNILIKLLIGFASVLAVIMIVIGGLEYMTSELMNTKEQGRERISNAILGLVIALGSWALLNTLNPKLLDVCLDKLPEAKITIQNEQIRGRLGQGNCVPVSDSTSLCSPDNLTKAGFSNGTQASSICNGESLGATNPNIASGVDVCEDNNPFSFGLFQINVLAHADEIPACGGIFRTNANPPAKMGTSINDTILGGCLDRDKTGIVCLKYACDVADQKKYNTCVSYITNPVNNIAFALKLQQSRGWGQWGFNASCHF